MIFAAPAGETENSYGKIKKIGTIRGKMAFCQTYRRGSQTDLGIRGIFR
jgi:hypothetical protein